MCRQTRRNTVKIGGDICQYTGTMPPPKNPARNRRKVVGSSDASHIVTHKQVLPGVEERFDAIREACEYRLAH
jgi:hypothetical protein